MNLSANTLSKLFFTFGLLVSMQSYSQENVVAKNDAVPADTYRSIVKIEEEKQVFSIFPATVKKSARIIVESNTDGWATFELKGNCGEILLEQQMAVSKGHNRIPLFFISQVDKGTYTTVLKVEDKVYFSKLVKE